MYLCCSASRFRCQDNKSFLHPGGCCAGCLNLRKIPFTLKPVKTALPEKSPGSPRSRKRISPLNYSTHRILLPDHAPPVQHTVLVSLLLQGTLRPGIDQQPISLKTGESPSHLFCIEVILFCPENDRILGRAYISRSIPQFSPQLGYGHSCPAFDLPYRLITHVISSTHLFMPPSLISSSTEQSADILVSAFPNIIIIQLEEIFTCHCKL